MDNNNKRPGDFEFPDSKNGELISKEQLASLRGSARSNVPAKRPGSNAPEVRFPQETSLDAASDVSGDTIAVNSIKNEVTFGDAKKDTFGKPASRPAHIAIKDEADNADFKDVKTRKKKLRKRIILGVVFGIIGILIGCVGFLLWYEHHMYSKMNVVETQGTIVDESGNTVRIADLTQPTQHEIINEDHIHNFLLIGIDSRSRGAERGNSDVNMVVSVDTEAGTIKMISIARDTYAHIPGYRDQKINAAMALGGPELLEATIEQCLRIDIEGFAYVDFYNLADVIDAVGGVYIDASSAEVYGDHGLNMCLDELGYGDQAVNQTGYIWVNGRQAVAYGRIRYVDSDYKRSERQVEVLRSLLDQFTGLSAASKLSTMGTILEMISTNVTEEEATSYVVDFLPTLGSDPEIQYIQLPIEGCYNSGMYGGEWSIRANWNAYIPFVQEFFYGEQTDFDPVDPIGSEPDLASCPTPDTLPIEELLR